MSEHGYPDYQRYAQWFGAPLVDATGLAIGAGSHTDGPLQVNNWSSVILYVKPTGGSITATIRQTSSGITSGLVSDTTVSVAAGATKVQPVVLVGNSVSLILQGSTGGETVDYSLVPANTAVNAGSVSSPVLNLTPIPLASWPPAAPANGDLQVLELPSAYDPVGGKLLRWLCMYDSTNGQWDVAGPPLYAEVQTGEQVSSVAYAAMATAGPTVTLPRAGDYQVEVGALLQVGVVAAARQLWMSYDIGGTGAVDGDAYTNSGDGTTGVGPTGSRVREKAGLTAVSLTSKYRVSSVAGGATIAAQNRWLRVKPVRIT